MKILTKSLFAFSFLFFMHHISAQNLSPTVNMTFRSKLGFGMSCANICGFSGNSGSITKEFALVGNYQGMAIVDVTNPNTPINLQQMIAKSSSWREIKVYRNYAYITTEADSSGLQIVDLAPLLLPSPKPAVLVNTYRGGDSALYYVRRIHALHIDTAKGFAYLYGGVSYLGPNNTIPTNGAIVLDIKTDPINPRFVGKTAEVASNSVYIHDGYVRNDTLFSGNILAGLFSVIDFRDKKNPIVLNTQTTPTNFNHNSWLTDDSKTLLTTDENQGSYLAAYDVSNPYNIRYLDKIRTVAENNAIVHNTHIINDFAVTSWYSEGVTVVDVHRPQNLVQVGQFDTYGGTGTAFVGCWGVYPNLPSGNLICSNYTDTLFVLTPQYVRACYLEGTTTDASTGLILGGVLIKINSTDMDKKASSTLQGIYRTGQANAGTVSVTYSRAGYVTQTVTGIVLANGVVTLKNVALVPITIPIELIDFQGFVEKNKTKLTWQTASEINVADFKIEKLVVENNTEIWSAVGSQKPNNAPSSYVLFDDNPTVGTNYYRLKSTDVDGSFKISKTIAVEFFTTKSAVYLFPNPVKNRVFLSENTLKNDDIVEILDISGKVILRTTVGQGRNGFDIEGLAMGDYFLRIGENKALKFKKIM
jgi:choice-of-anchor B domain-containing protein